MQMGRSSELWHDVLDEYRYSDYVVPRVFFTLLEIQSPDTEKHRRERKQSRHSAPSDTCQSPGTRRAGGASPDTYRADSLTTRIIYRC